MKSLVALRVGVSLIAASVAHATPKDQNSSPSADTADGGNPCAQYGEGYQQVPGTDTCVKVSGYIQATGGTSNGSGH
jgi:hypothetical protein